MIEVQSSGWFRCGGCLIGPGVVLTAAHCVTEPAMMTVIGGRNWRLSPARPRQMREVRRILEHEAYSEEGFKNDIALLLLYTPFDIDGIDD